MGQSKMTDEEYSQRQGQLCPFCESDEIETIDDLDADGDCAWQGVVCRDCEKQWTDLFKLVGFEENY